MRSNKQTIRVFVRTRPTTHFAQKNYRISPAKRTIEVTVGSHGNRQQNYNFQYNGVLHNASQEEVFNCCTDIVESVLDGFNGTIFCYGQTGAGKTYTITGPPDQGANYKLRGIMPRSIDHVFQEIHNRPEKSFKLFVSYVEIYNDKLYDLLNYNEKGTSLRIIELSKDNIFVRGLKKVPVRDEEECLSLMFEGETQRVVCEHVLNAESSRSHCIFTLYVESSSRVESSGQRTFSKLNLVDLAGSERVKKTKSVGRVLNEAKFINRSLSFLEQVVIALSSPKRGHVPYRQSQLTHLLTDSIGGNSKTTMIANIWGEKDKLEETISTLKFATRIMRVSNNAIVNVLENPEMKMNLLEKQVRELRRELAMHDQLKGVTEVKYDEYSEEQRVELRKKLLKFCNSEVSEAEPHKDVLEVKNLRQIRESFTQFRVIVQNLKADLKKFEEMDISQIQESRKVGEQKGESLPEGEKSRKSFGAPEKVKKRVGKIEESSGFAYGSGVPAKHFGKSQRKPLDKATPRKSPEENPENKKEKQEKESLGKNDAYERFKIEEGKELFENVKNNIDVFRKRKSEYHTLGKAINETKRELDSVKMKLNEKKLTSCVEEGVVDEELQLLYTQLKEKKLEYSKVFEERKSLKQELTYMSNIVDVSRRRLVDGFEKYYSSNFEMVGEVGKLENPEDDDKLDDAELFDRLEEKRIKKDDPQSYMFYKAFKKSRVKVKRSKMKKY